MKERTCLPEPSASPLGPVPPLPLFGDAPVPMSHGVTSEVGKTIVLLGRMVQSHPRSTRFGNEHASLKADAKVYNGVTNHNW